MPYRASEGFQHLVHIINIIPPSTSRKEVFLILFLPSKEGYFFAWMIFTNKKSQELPRNF